MNQTILVSYGLYKLEWIQIIFNKFLKILKYILARTCSPFLNCKKYGDLR